MKDRKLISAVVAGAFISPSMNRNSQNWRWLRQQFDASILSDEAATPGFPSFTGAFVGMACQDMAGTALPADFGFSEYQERPYRKNPFVR